MAESQAPYRLPERRTGTAMLGLAVPQVILSAVGILAAVLLPTRSHGAAVAVVGVAAAVGCGLLAFAPVRGQPAYVVLPPAAGHLARGALGRARWTMPLPGLSGRPRASGADSVCSGNRRRGRLPACLAGVELWTTARPDWAGADRTVAAVGLVHDRRFGTVTGALEVRGSELALLERADRHRQLAGWAQVLSQFGREASAVSRLGWSLWSAPSTLAEHRDWLTRTGAVRGSPATATYRQLLDEAAEVTRRHDLRLWLTVDPRRHGRAADAAEAAVAALRALTERCAAAGLVVSAPLSPLHLARAVREQADPASGPALDRVHKGLAEHAGLAGCGLVDATHVSPLAVESYWDAARIDGAWHRVFWVAQWPALDLDPLWWQPLLVEATGVRTIAVIMEPVSPQKSRRRINAETVSVEGQLRLRERHTFRIPTRLQHAHAEVDQREAELNAGHPEYAYLALVAVTGRSRDELDQASHDLADDAARCGIRELRPLYGRHDAAWACTLPIGRVPDRGLLDRGAE